MNKVKAKICDKGFAYNEPYFYNNHLALRCELGVDKEKYLESAVNRAREICEIVFKGKVDCFFIDQFFYNDDTDNQQILKYKSEFLYEEIDDISIVEDDWEETPVKITRSVFYPDRDITNELIKENIVNHNAFHSHLVSYDNDCIVSIYDERGLDIVFFNEDKYCEMYEKLFDYLLQYDIEVMRKKYDKLNGKK